MNTKVTQAQIEQILADAEAAEAARASSMPDTRDALRVQFQAFLRLKELGWKEACYCPKDGSTFEAIEAGSTGIFRCHYQGDWPTGTYWIEDGGDLWPSRPILFRHITQPQGGSK